MNGGYNPIKDIYKTEVFRLSTLRNSWKPEGALGPSGEVIPPNIITRPPTAELRETRPTRIRCRLTMCWTAFWSGWWSGKSR
jgi:NH3-dependent NAD+ synthetase